MLEAPAIYGPKYGLVACYSVDNEVSGDGLISDDTTNNNHASSSGTIVVRTGQVGSSFEPYSSNAELLVPALGFAGDMSITIAAWIRVEAGASARNNVFGFGDPGTANRSCSVRTDGDGKVLFYFWNNGLTATCPNYYGSWTHVAAVYDAAASQRRIYVNGTQEATNSAPTPPEFVDQNYSAGGYADEWFEGRIDELRVYRRPLAAAEISELAAQ